MKPRLLIALAAIALAAAPSAAQEHRPDFPYELDIPEEGPPLHYTAIRYGPKSWQVLNYVKGKGGPLVVDIASGDWRSAGQDFSMAWLADYLTRKGNAYAWIGFGDLPDITPEAAAAEIAAAIARLRRQPERVRFDPGRIILLGRGSGAHFAALLATDLSWLEAARVQPAAICATISLEGDGFDIPRRIADAANPLRRDSYIRAFGADPAAQAHASPAHHAAAPNAGAFLLLNAADSPESARQADEFAALLRAAGTPAERGDFPKWNWRNRRTWVGLDENPGSRRITAFLAAHCGGDAR